jgi:hypothetical protein
MVKNKRRKMQPKKKHNIHLEDIEKKNNFNVPDGYFNNFSSRLKEKLKIIDPGDIRTPERSTLFSLNSLALAASVSGLIILLYTGIALLTNHQGRSKFGNEKIADVIDFPNCDIDDHMLFEIYSSTPSYEQHNIDKDENQIINAMIEYLLYTNADVSTLIQEL